MEFNHQKSDPYVIFAAFGHLQEYENLHFPSTFAILSLIRIRSGQFLAQKPFPCHRFWDLPVWWLCAVLDFACTFAILSLIRIRSGQFFATFFFVVVRFGAIPVWLALQGI